jgi:hypothetical protein
LLATLLVVSGGEIVLGMAALLLEGYRDWRTTGLESRFLFPLVCVLLAVLLVLAMGFLNLVDRWETSRDSRKGPSGHGGVHTT